MNMRSDPSSFHAVRHSASAVFNEESVRTADSQPAFPKFIALAVVTIGLLATLCWTIFLMWLVGRVLEAW
jgi:hypothetical protein